MSVPSMADLAYAEPEVARKFFRSGGYFQKCTSGICQGYVQTNLLALHKSLADDFAKFCAVNSGTLPILFQSDVGHFTAPGLTQTDTDIRTDLPGYNVIENGQVSRAAKDMMEFEEFLNDFVFFYKGCSFSFDRALLAAGVPLRNLEQNCSVSLFVTNVKCHPVGPFKCQMGVSLRPIPRDLVETACKVTHPLTDFHGAPVHIGDPGLIGIDDISKPDYMDPMTFEEGDVPVFWGCGITVVDAIKAANATLAFSHHPGCMYISDTILPQNQDTSSADICVVTLYEQPYWASLTSKSVVQQIEQLDGFVAEESVGHNDRLAASDNLLKSVLTLSHASSVAVTTGSLNNSRRRIDGVPGAIAVAMMLQALGKKVDLVVDEMLYAPLIAVLDALEKQKVLSTPISVVHFPPDGEKDDLETAERFLLGDGSAGPRYDHLLGIWSAEHAENHVVSAVNRLFLAAANIPRVHTSGIVYGMGKVENILRGPSFDFHLTAGVSNWGSYAVAIALYLVSTCPIHERYRRRALGFPPSEDDRERFRAALPNADREEQVMRTMASHDLFDITEKDLQHVKDVHAKKIEQLLSIIGEK